MPGGEEAAPSGQEAFLKLIPGLPAKSKAQREAAFSALMEAGAPLGEPLLQALEREHAQGLRRLARHLKAVEPFRQKLKLKGNLDEKRRVALGLIRDRARYKKGPDLGKVQTEVHRLVQETEACHKASQEILKALRAREGFEPLLEALSEVEGYLERAGRPPSPAERAKALLAEGLPGIDYALEAQTAREAEAFRAANEALAARMAKEDRMNPRLAAHEADMVKRINLYRIMMGLKPIPIDLRLVDASRRRSQDMKAKKADLPSPSAGAQAAGFPGTATFFASDSGYVADSAFWLDFYTNPGAQRNMLREDWTAIGAAVFRKQWTVMPGKEQSSHVPAGR